MLFFKWNTVSKWPKWIWFENSQISTFDMKFNLHRWIARFVWKCPRFQNAPFDWAKREESSSYQNLREESWPIALVHGTIETEVFFKSERQQGADCCCCWQDCKRSNLVQNHDISQLPHIVLLPCVQLVFQSMKQLTLHTVVKSISRPGQNNFLIPKFKQKVEQMIIIRWLETVINGLKMAPKMVLV